MKLATQITLFILGIIFSLMAMSANTVRMGTLYASASAGAFSLLLVALSIL